MSSRDRTTHRCNSDDTFLDLAAIYYHIYSSRRSSAYCYKLALHSEKFRCIKLLLKDNAKYLTRVIIVWVM